MFYSCDGGGLTVKKPLLRLKLQSPSLCHQLPCMMLMTRKLPPVEQINSNEICSAGINSMCTYTQTRTFGNGVIYINLLNQDKKRAAAKPRIHLSCVVSACVCELVHIVSVKCLRGCCCLEATMSLKVK